MCWHLTLAIPPGYDLPRPERGLGIHPPTADLPCLPAFPQGWGVFEVTSGGCACALYAPPDGEPDHAADELNRLRARYARRGWSAAKIERAVRDHAAHRHMPTTPARTDAFREQVVRWAAEYGEIMLFAHWAARQDAAPSSASWRIAKMDADAFLRQGFPPQTLVHIQIQSMRGKHGTGMV